MNKIKKLQELTKNIHHWYMRETPNDVKGMARTVLDVERHLNDVHKIYAQMNDNYELTEEVETLRNECEEMTLAIFTNVSLKVTKKEIIIDYIKAYDTLKEQDAQLQKNRV